MARTLLEALGLFAAPFVLYVLLLVARRRYPTLAEHWSGGRVAGLAVAGLGLVAAGLLLLGALSERHQGAWTPAHLDGGRLIPGHMQ